MEHFNCWNGVNREVLRGIKLREEKIKLCPIPKQYEIDFALSEPSCSKTPPWYNLYKSAGKLNATQEYGLSSNYTNGRKYTNITKKRKKISSNKPFRRVKTRCPLRVAELSVPTKRHCLETWRKNQDVLPTFMIERLRQIIMDEKPIVKIYDAVDCFKRQRTSKSRSRKRQTKRKQDDQLRIFCAFLSYKIMYKLLRPLNLTLNSQLQNLSRVVNDEITNISKGPKMSKVYSNNQIQAEIADKITVWIVNVLEESAYKLLLEDFEELREKEGSVWDLIDDLIDNVVVICEPVSVVSSSANEIAHLSVSSISKPTLYEEHNIVVEANDSINDDILSKSEDTQQINIVDLIIAEILDNIIYNDEIQNPSVMSLADSLDYADVNIDENVTNSNGSILKEKRSNEYLTANEAFSGQETFLTDIDSQINTLHEVDNSTNIVDDNFESEQVNDNVTDLEKDKLIIMETNKEMEHNINMTSSTDNIENTGRQIDLQKEDTPDDSIKKVKFSNLNIGLNARKTSVSNDSNSLFIQEHYDFMPRKFSKDGSIKSELRFAPPNEHLLSPADESWPENIQFPVLKASISVSKSISSLGKILENEEKLLPSVDKDPILSYNRKDSINESIQADINDEIEKNKNEKFFHENYNKDQYDQENNAPDMTSSFVNVIRRDVLDKGDTTRTKNSAKDMIVEHMPIIDIKPKEVKNTEITLEKVTQTEIEALENIFTHIHSTGDFLSCRKRYDESKKVTCSCANFKEGYKGKEIYVLKWCQGLENVMQNLELWKDWVEKTCNCIITLNNRGVQKHKASRFKDNIHMWSKLKSNVEADSKIWRKVSKKLKRGMTHQRNYYLNHKVSFFRITLFSLVIKLNG